MSLLEWFRWIQFSEPLIAMRSSPWLFPLIATIHLFGLALIGGAVLVVDLRLLGLGLRQHPGQLVRDTDRWLLRGLLVMIATGIPLFMCFATKYYYLTFFWVKMAALIIVVIFTYTIRRRVAMAGDAGFSPLVSRMVAVVSIALWTTVAIGGRWIGFP